VYLSPATPGAVEYTTGIIRDIVQRYAIDGVHFDYLRYPGDDFDYGRETLRVFGQSPARAPERWRQFRGERLTALLTSLRSAVKTARPAAVISATVSQEAWVTQGLLDVILRRIPEPSPDIVKRHRFERRARRSASRRRGRIFPSAGVDVGDSNGPLWQDAINGVLDTPFDPRR
jgi:uncharacterized lipoprotein YddW (UPF0748 family)